MWLFYSWVSGLSATPWWVNQSSVGSSEELTIEAGEDLVIGDNFDVQGSLIVNGKLSIL